MKKRIENEIKTFIREYQQRPSVRTEFGEPLVGFADAASPYIQNLPAIVAPGHVLPQDVLAAASVIVSYYVPFTKELARGNSSGDIASPAWALAYEEANAMFAKLNSHIIDVIKGCGFHGVVPAAASAFHSDTLKSDWSQRHIAYAAGLGTFGINNMLITRSGCCGRYNSIVTDIPQSILAADSPMTEELCLYKRNGSCGICRDLCPAGALQDSSFLRDKCYEVCLKNAAIYPAGCFDDGSVQASYAGSSGSEVCGKCVTGAACAFWRL